MRFKIAILSIVYLSIYEPLTFGQSTSEEGWLAIKSAYLSIYYRPDVDLKTIEKRLKRRSFYINKTPRRLAELDDPQEKVAYRMDLLLDKVREMLDMSPIMKLKIKIFKNQKELDDEYYRIFGKRENYRSFYIHKYETIYTSEDNISDSLVAHEMGHAVVDHYFLIVPPENVREILATYLDSHLED